MFTKQSQIQQSSNNQYNRYPISPDFSPLPPNLYGNPDPTFNNPAIPLPFNNPAVPSPFPEDNGFNPYLMPSQDPTLNGRRFYGGGSFYGSSGFYGSKF